MKRLSKIEPVVAGDIVKIVAWLVSLLIAVGALTAGDGDEVNEVSAAIAPIVAMGINAAVAYWQRAQVTPLADPRDNDGNPLRADEFIVP